MVDQAPPSWVDGPVFDNDGTLSTEKQMVELLSYVQVHRSLSLLIRHDDDTRRGDMPHDTGAKDALAAADEHGFVVVNVRDDWSEVFARDPT